MKAVRATLVLLVLLVGARLDAQQYFGMNQVQYKHFDWRVIETEDWSVHYSPEERDGSRAHGRALLRASFQSSRPPVPREETTHPLLVAIRVRPEQRDWRSRRRHRWCHRA